MRRVALVCGGLLLCQSVSAQLVGDNSIYIVVGGQKVITQRDVNIAARRNRISREEAQKRLEYDALLVMNIKGSKQWIEPAGLIEWLLENTLKKQFGNDRNEMLRALRQEGKTLRQFEQELLDQELIRQAYRTVRQAVQVSPAAIKKYYREHPDMNDKGVTVDLHTIRFPRDEEGINLAKVQALKNEIKSLAGFKKLADSRKEPLNGHNGIIHKDGQNVEFNESVVDAIFDLDSKEVGVAFDKQAYYLIYVEKKWDKYEIPIAEVHKVIEEELNAKLFESQMKTKIDNLRRDIHVYEPRRRNR
ncbi:MAG: peptidyl-prolyl cis-trans isomerase [Verrucomicrobiota bacterium]|nr:peptidyl-prolyl cis-trans isomerase [Verrucomicrobiota bacterium]